MSRTAKIYGNVIDVKNAQHVLPEEIRDMYHLGTQIEVSSLRSSNEATIIHFDDTDLLALRFSDQTEWIGHPSDVQAIYDPSTQAKRAQAAEDYLFETQIISASTERGAVQQAFVKVFSVFKRTTSQLINIKAIGEKYDQRIQPQPGLYALDKAFRHKSLQASKQHEPYLLFIHGTLSSVRHAFYDLTTTDTWSQLIDQYGTRILALEHYTLSLSPLQNVVDFLTACPSGIVLDIMSHSRGGLVADVIAKCDYQNSDTAVVGFSENELLIFKKKDKVSYDLMLQINALAQEKKIHVRKVVRVAAPSSGTTILSRRTDHYFILVLNTIGLAFGIQNPIYGIIKSFLLEILSQKDDPSILPGLHSMVPDSLFQKMLNGADTQVASALFTIAGNAEVNGMSLQSLKVILANLFYLEANDLVVDTDRMEHGVQRMHGYRRYVAQDALVNHFTYFKHSGCCEALVKALTIEDVTVLDATFSHELSTAGDRGIILDKLSLGGVNYRPKELTRDVVIVIPGIMGSTIEAAGEDIWIQMRQIHRGAIASQLKYNAPAVGASGVVKKFYDKFCKHLSSQYDVITLDFDWRLSVAQAAIKLKNELEALSHHQHRVHIVAHSMGGVVARQCMMDHEDTWNQVMRQGTNRFVMLGTPWLGSYLIMEVLTGHSKRVKQLAAIDFRNDKEDLLKVFWRYPGVFELLPIDAFSDREFASDAFWQEIKDTARLEHMPNPKTHKKPLKDFNAYRKKVLAFLERIKDDKAFFSNVYYVCGKADKTVFDYTFKDRFLSKKKKLVYKATSEGDGSVTWKTGIPEPLRDSSNLFYTSVSHGELANASELFEGIVDLLELGTTAKLQTTPPASRAGEVITEVHEYAAPVSDTKRVIDTLFDCEVAFAKAQKKEIHVKVINGDLKVASYPVMVGHFFMDLILSAEKALDGYLENRLSQRLDIGYYPGKIGESEVFFNLNTQPRGAIVCGLGSTDGLTSFLLSKTVKLATLKYAMFMRDNYTLPRAKRYASGISFILIGIGYGKLLIEDSLKGILLGVSEANSYIESKGEGLKRIEEIEIINYYESVASQAYFSLSRMRDDDNRIAIHLDPGVIRRAGAKKKQLFADSAYTWWYSLHITSLLDKSGFKYYSTRGLARVEQEYIGIATNDIKQLLALQSSSSHWDIRLSKALFEMLIPNDFKNVFRNQGNLILKLDKKSAEIPWELLHDTEAGTTPTAVSATFIRQLVTGDGSNQAKVSLHNNNVFIVGDPIYNQEDLPSLPAARSEALWVLDSFKGERYHTIPLIGKQAPQIMMELYNRQYKIMHFAGHGLYDPDQGQVGIVIGNGICIDPQKIRQIGYVPEFVFINCCYSGTMDARDDKYTQERYRLAANVGTELIEMGVKAIIISGWAVDDAAAKTFAETFYCNMFDGYDFGTSVQKARLACFQQYPATNTWGAYQCYGNQFYKFNNRRKGKRVDLEYVIASQVHTDMDNLLIAIRDRKHNTETTLKKLNTYLDKAERANLLDAFVLEKEALIYNELDMQDIAHQKFKELFKYANGNFSIEALEQYCVIKTHHLTKKNLTEDLNEISFLTLIGENPSRLNIVANAYKFASLVVSTKKEKVAYLRKAFMTYEKSYLASSNPHDGDFLDALTNMIFIGHILEILEGEPLLERLQKSKAFADIDDVESYLSGLYSDLEKVNNANLDVSVLIGMAEAKYGLILLKSDFKPDMEMDIIAGFKYIFDLLYSPRFINIELRQIDFLLHYIQEDGIRTQLELIRDEVAQLRFSS